jgi:hypothetical protein
MAKFTPKGVIRGPNSPQNGPKCRNFKMVRFRPLIARSKNLAKADLMRPPQELSIFPPRKSPCFVGSYRVGAVKQRTDGQAHTQANTFEILRIWGKISPPRRHFAFRTKRYSTVLFSRRVAVACGNARRCGSSTHSTQVV